MKRKIISICFALWCLLTLTASTVRVVLNDPNHQPNHSQYPVPADMPDVYYNEDTQEVIIDGPGMATYYTVDIISTTTLNVMLSDIVGGYYDSIDVSSLPGDDYKIVIVSSNNNTYEGYFNNE